MRRYGVVAYALAASVIVLIAASLFGPAGPAAARAATATGAVSAGAVSAGAAAPTPVETPEVTPEVTPETTPEVTPTGEASCPTLSEWNSETHDGTHPGPVPNVIGMTRDNASATLAQAGFDTEARPSGAGDWLVDDQAPTGEELANCGSTVAIDLEAPTVVVPDVVGYSRNKAEAALRAAGLLPSVADGEGIAADLGVVASQDPAAGTRVPGGSTVTLRLRPTVPDSPTPEGVTPTPEGVTPGTGQTDPASPDITPSDSTQVIPINPDEVGSSSTPLPLVLVAALVGAAVLVWALRRARRRRPGPPATPSVVWVPYADLSPSIEIRELAVSLRLEFVCHHDQGYQEIREIVR
jgi:hypothetical protein